MKNHQETEATTDTILAYQKTGRELGLHLEVKKKRHIRYASLQGF
jgi:hypothetical protein